MENLKVNISGPLRGSVRVPGDKSISHRAVMLGAIAEGTSRVSGFLTGEDSVNTAKALAAMGVEIEGLGGSELVIHGVGLHGLKPPRTCSTWATPGPASGYSPGFLRGRVFRRLLRATSIFASAP